MCVTRGVAETFQASSPIQELPYAGGGFLGVNGHKLLVGEIVPPKDHVAGKLLRTVIWRAIHSEHRARASAVNGNLAVSRDGGAAPGDQTLRDHENVSALIRCFESRPGTGCPHTDNQDIAAQLLKTRSPGAVRVRHHDSQPPP
jgi:hypothetical protein